jgi:hypothetical protein
MRRYFFILCFFSLLFLNLSAQKEDYQWVGGYPTFTVDSAFGGTIFDFNGPSLNIYRHDRQMRIANSHNASICDSSGNLLFYTNGCYIANYDDEMIENGDGINAGEIYDSFCGPNTNGYPSGFQSSIVLPQPNTSGIYYLFHKKIFNTFNPSWDVHTHFLLYSIVDMNQNNGKGKVTQKNILAYQDTLAFGDMTAVRHANGVDWWLMSPGDRNNNYFVFLFNHQGISLTHKFTIGDVTPLYGEGAGQSFFSYDGTKYIRFNPTNKIRMFDFDRSTGVLSNYQKINVDFGAYDPGDGGSALSPSGQYFYVSVKRYLYQMDLWAADIEASQTLVGTYDGYADPLAANFGRGILGPDCKLYIFSGNASKVIHIIHNPDKLGLDCNFEQHALSLYTFHKCIPPNFPNFRLRHSI